MAHFITRPARTIRVTLSSALVLSLVNLAGTPATAQRLTRPTGTAQLGANRVVERSLKGLRGQRVERRYVDRRVPATLPVGTAQALQHDGGVPDATWREQARLADPDGVEWDYFGISAALSGNTAVIGSSGENKGNGVVDVFVRSGSAWTQQATLTASDGAAGYGFSMSVAVSGDTVVVGAPYENNGAGAAYVFARNGTTWTEQAELTDPLPHGPYGDIFGWSVSISGNTIMVGAPLTGNNETGAAYVYARSGSTWTLQATLADPLPQHLLDGFGNSVAVSGDTATVGANGKNNSAGAAYVYGRSGTAWAQQATLTASDSQPFDSFGSPVAISGDTALVGASGKSTGAGAAYVFVRSGTTWSQQQEFTATGSQPNDCFGCSLALSGDTAVIGALYKNNYQGAAYVYARSGNTWSQQAMFAGAPRSQLGTSVAASENTAIVGADHAKDQSGAAYVFVRSGAASSPEPGTQGLNSPSDVC